MSLTSDLWTEFEAVCTQAGLDYDGAFAYDLLVRYNEPYRAYHNARHIKSVLDRIDELAPVTKYTDLDLPPIKLAAFYHDAVYVPGFEHNEHLSAEMARSHLKLMGAPAGFMICVDTMIRETKMHLPPSWDIASRLLVDADLYELGTDRYEKNRCAVRMEFGDVPEDKWRKGRRAFLESFLSRERIFYLPGQGAVEVRARENMLDELEQLKESE